MPKNIKAVSTVLEIQICPVPTMENAVPIPTKRKYGVVHHPANVVNKQKPVKYNVAIQEKMSSLTGYIENAKAIIRDSSYSNELKNMMIQQINFIVRSYPVSLIENNISNLLASFNLSTFVRGGRIKCGSKTIYKK